MSLGNAALLAGLLVVPLLLLQLGHRLRDRTHTQRGVFWGGVIGHSVGAAVTCIALALPPVMWSEDGGGLRVLAVYGGMVIGAVAGMIIGALAARSAARPDSADRRASSLH